MPEEVKSEVFKNRKDLLSKLKIYINAESNQSKKLFYSSRIDHERVKTIDAILALFEISKAAHEASLSISISRDKDFQLYLKRPPISCFVNNYFSESLIAWEANLGIQPVFNHDKDVAYMCAYLSKCEDECSQAMSQAIRKHLSVISTTTNKCNQ